jgi:hypothetical protein
MIGRVLNKKKDIIQDGVIKKIHNGYYFVKCGLDYVTEHQLVVENKIKRMLVKGETVHHIDGNKLNNELNNLMLFKSQNEHKSFENKIRQFGLTNPIKRVIENRWKEFE